MSGCLISKPISRSCSLPSLPYIIPAPLDTALAKSISERQSASYFGLWSIPLCSRAPSHTLLFRSYHNPSALPPSSRDHVLAGGREHRASHAWPHPAGPSCYARTRLRFPCFAGTKLRFTLAKQPLPQPVCTPWASLRKSSLCSEDGIASASVAREAAGELRGRSPTGTIARY